MELFYVQRNTNGEINGLFSHPYPEAIEALPEDHPDVVAFLTRPKVVVQPVKPVGPTEV